MTAYTQHTVFSVGVGPTGHVHTRANDDGRPFAVDCAACEPFLIKEGWVANRDLVPQTDRQIADQDRMVREGNEAVKQVAERLAASAARELMYPEPSRAPAAIAVAAPEPVANKTRPARTRSRAKAKA